MVKYKNMIKELLKKLWQWILDQTTLDEKFQEVVDDVEEATAEVKHRVKRVKEEVADVVEVAQSVKKQIKDVSTAVTGSERKGRKQSTKITKSSLREMKKDELINHAATKFKVTFDDSLNKTTLINKIYELYHKK
jgi:uncharacterized protein YoxC